MRVRLFAPLRDKVTSSIKPLVPWTGQRSRLSILTEPHDELVPFHSIVAAVRGTDVTKYWIGLPRQSALMLAARTTLPHFSVSSAMSLPKSAGETTSGVTPKTASRAFILGSARPALISLLSLSTMSTGVFLGMPTPYQLLAS